MLAISLGLSLRQGKGRSRLSIHLSTCHSLLLFYIPSIIFDPSNLPLHIAIYLSTRTIQAFFYLAHPSRYLPSHPPIFIIIIHPSPALHHHPSSSSTFHPPIYPSIPHIHSPTSLCSHLPLSPSVHTHVLSTYPSTYVYPSIYLPAIEKYPSSS